MPYFVIEVNGKRETVLEADNPLEAVDMFAQMHNGGNVVGVAARPMLPGQEAPFIMRTNRYPQ